ncbi:MAG: hypothetical protein HRT89_22665 [Lentisphaeria bacterium]|nr:hypothetical protein [Lentisphaeria bacterium]NQZ70863.1 hypothetical protein [Lentisphaeria bacterium]
MKHCIFTLLLSGIMFAGTELNLRIIEMSKTGTVAAGLADIKRPLKRLNYQGFIILQTKKIALPANETIKSGSLSIQLSGKQGDLLIRVNNRKKELLKTTVSIKDGKPLMMTVPGKVDGKSLLLVFLIK